MKSGRVLLLLVLTVLLPLRSALAVTMGLPVTEPPTRQTPATATAPSPVQAVVMTDQQSGSQAHAPAHSPAPPHPLAEVPEEAPHCPHHAAPADATGSGHPAGHPAQAHLLCDVCNGPALSAALVSRLGGTPAPLGIPERIERFASVVLPIGHKPPIPA